MLRSSTPRLKLLPLHQLLTYMKCSHIYVQMASQFRLSVLCRLVCRPSVCRLSVTFVHSTQPVKIFNDISKLAQEGMARLSSTSYTMIHFLYRELNPEVIHPKTETVTTLLTYMKCSRMYVRMINTQHESKTLFKLSIIFKYIS